MTLENLGIVPTEVVVETTTKKEKRPRFESKRGNWAKLADLGVEVDKDFKLVESPWLWYEGDNGKKIEVQFGSITRLGMTTLYNRKGGMLRRRLDQLVDRLSKIENE
jgi:hypothetical protein